MSWWGSVMPSLMLLSVHCTVHSYSQSLFVHVLTVPLHHVTSLVRPMLHAVAFDAAGHLN